MKLSEFFTLTQSERKIVILLTVALLAGGLFSLVQSGRDTGAMRGQVIAEQDSLYALYLKELASDTLSLKLDVNSATKQELEQIPGITPLLAERIVRKRTELGSFRRIDELLQVPGIGTQRFEQITEFLEIH